MNETSITNSFSTHLKQAFAKAYNFAVEFGHLELTSMHLLYGLAAQKGSLSSELLLKIDFPVDLLKQELIRAYHQPFVPQAPSSPSLSDELITVLTKSTRTAQLYEHTYIGTEHVLACILNLANQELRNLLQLWQINTNDLQQQLLMVLKSTSKFPDLTDTLRQLQENQDDVSDIDQDYPITQSLAKELTTPEFLQEATPLIGRQTELERVQQLLLRRFKNNPLLVGKAGVGKTAIVEGLAHRILSGDVPPMLLGKRVFHLELSSLVAGTMYRGEFEQRLKMLVDECRMNPEIVLFIDEIHTLIGAGSTGQALDAANILKPALARGEIRCIGATTWQEYNKHLHQDSALARRFQVVAVEEPSEMDTKEILHGTKDYLQDYHHVRITNEAIDHAIQLSRDHLPSASWPDKALDLLDEAAARKKLNERIPAEQEKRVKLKKRLQKLQKQKQEALHEDLYEEALKVHEKIESVLIDLKKTAPKPRKRMHVKPVDIVEALIAKTGMSKNQITFSEKTRTNIFIEEASKSIIGQDHVLNTLQGFIDRAYSPLKDPRKPLGSFLFLGPSGVGKTATAKELAKSLFGNEKALIRLDMSEYVERYSVSKLLGAPAGYIGHKDTGLLTKAIQEQPRSILLFDEIEKAHPDLFNLLLQILDEGQLTDSAGNKLDFRQSVIVLTSNLGTDALRSKVGFGERNSFNHQEIEQELASGAKSFLRQELLNRLDETLIFKPLGIQSRQAIITKKLQELNQQLANQLTLAIADETIHQIATSAYKDEEGVRSLERFFKQQVEIPLQKHLSSSAKASKAELICNNEAFQLELI